VRRIRKFAQLSWRGKVLVTKCWMMLNLTALALWIFSLPTLLKTFGTNSESAKRTTEHGKDEILWSIRAASAFAWRPTCAVRGLVGERLLRLNGLPARFKVGVTRDASEFQAHAWVEDESGIVIGASEQEYHRLPDLADRRIPSRS
jgi:hypothetical protein